MLKIFFRLGIIFTGHIKTRYVNRFLGVVIIGLRQTVVCKCVSTTITLLWHQRWTCRRN